MHTLKITMKSWLGAGLVLGLMSLSIGCGGVNAQVKGAMVDHAKATRAVADTLTKTLPSIKCDPSAVTNCIAALQVVELQIKSLREGADQLENASK